MHKEYCFHVIMAPTILADHKEDTVIIIVEGISQNKEKQKLSFKRYVVHYLDFFNYI